MAYNNVGRLYQLLENGTLKAEYLYNDAGQRTRKTIYQADGITVDRITIYHYDQMGYLISETDQTGQLIKDYIWQEGMTPLAQIDNEGIERISYLYTDHLMTNRLATNDLQQVIWQWEGEAFGNTAAEEFTSTKVNLRFPGQYYDAETNLHYNHFRYYDPELGRYITSDPIGLKAGTNTYLYALANPIRYTDPLGLITPKAIPGHGSKSGQGPFGPICGAEGTVSATWIPDGPYTWGCKWHDECYSTCGRSKVYCDLGLFLRTGNTLYYIAVIKWGDEAYQNAQKEAEKYCDGCES